MGFQFLIKKIRETDLILDSFIDGLSDLDGNTSRNEIMKVVEEIVLALNELDEKFDHFIETDEREELWEFIDKGARNAGLEVEEREDITEEFREW